MVQNSGVRYEAIDDKGAKTTYFGFIEEIWELNYRGNMQVPIFKCQCVRHPTGVSEDTFGFKIVDLNNVGHKDDPWVLASRVAQVFYVIDPANERKHIVLPGKQRILGIDDVDDPEEYNEYDEMPLFTDDFYRKIKLVEDSINPRVQKQCVRHDGEGKVVTA